MELQRMMEMFNIPLATVVPLVSLYPTPSMNKQQVCKLLWKCAFEIWAIIVLMAAGNLQLLFEDQLLLGTLGCFKVLLLKSF